MEKSKSAKFRFNFFDVAVIAIIALIATGLAYIYFIGSAGAGPKIITDEVEFVLEIEMVDRSFKELIKEGDPVIAYGSNSIGEVTNVLIKDYVSMNDTAMPDGTDLPDTAADPEATGEATVTPVSKTIEPGGYVTIVLTIRCSGNWEDSALTVNGMRIREGSRIEAHTPKFTFNATCTSMKVIDDGEEG